MIEATTPVAQATAPDKQKYNGDYREYLASPHWEHTKFLKLKASNYKCHICREEDNLEIHHLHYKSLGKEHMDDLLTLCTNCHIYAHKLWPKQPNTLSANAIRIMTVLFVSSYSNSRRLAKKKQSNLFHKLSQQDQNFYTTSLKQYTNAELANPSSKPIPRYDPSNKPRQRRTPPKLNRSVLTEPTRRIKWVSKLTNRFK